MAELEKLQKELERRGFAVSRYATAGEAAEALSQAIRGKSVGIGGSMTVEALGLYDKLAPHNQVFWQARQGREEALTGAATAQVYITSANAVAQTGEIVNIDGTGNRVAATLYGHESVYIILGANKVAPDLESAIHRARNIAAPLNARRLGRQTPCASGELKCHDCDSPQRICRGLVVLWRKTGGVGRCEVVLIDQDLGY